MGKYMIRQTRFLIIAIFVLACSSKQVTPSETPVEESVGNEAVKLKSIAPRKISSANCAIQLPQNFYVDPTFLQNSSKFEFYDEAKNKFIELERQGTEQNSRFVIKDLSNGRVLGTAIWNARNPTSTIFDCDNYIVGFVRSHFKKDHQTLMASNAKKIVQFVSEGDPASPILNFKTTDGKSVFSMARLVENEREKWKVQIQDLNEFDPKYVLFVLSIKSFTDDLRRSQ